MMIHYPSKVKILYRRPINEQGKEMSKFKRSGPGHSKGRGEFYTVLVRPTQVVPTLPGRSIFPVGLIPLSKFYYAISVSYSEYIKTGGIAGPFKGFFQNLFTQAERISTSSCVESDGWGLSNRVCYNRVCF